MSISGEMSPGEYPRRNSLFTWNRQSRIVRTSSRIADCPAIGSLRGQCEVGVCAEAALRRGPSRWRGGDRATEGDDELRRDGQFLRAERHDPVRPKPADVDEVRLRRL